jgi:transcriptional repressor NrdR
MECPYCNKDVTRVSDTRQIGEAEVRRQRVCIGCGERFSTTERISAHDIVVVKRGERPNERFSRTKLRRGIEKAANVWAISANDVDAFVDRIVRRIRPTPSVPVTSTSIGELVLRVMEGESPVTDVARIRFAVVFRGRTSRTTRFRGLDDFISWMETEYGEAPANLVAGVTTVVKRDGGSMAFRRNHLERSIGLAAKGRGSDEDVNRLATAVASDVVGRLQGQSIVTSQQIAGYVLEILAKRDQLAYLRYASAVKRYRSVDDFWAEVMELKRFHSDAT